MKAHDLARKLLEGPDVEVFIEHPSEPDYPLRIDGVLRQGEYSPYDEDEYREENEEEPPPGEPVVILDQTEHDGVLS